MAEPLRVLVIDDEVAIRRFLRASLDPEEYELLEASDGSEGIRAVARLSPKIVLLDLGLPDIDGVEVARRIREWSDVPIIVLSARERERDKVTALDAGADDYLTKPFSIGELFARMRASLRRVQDPAASDSAFEAHGVWVDLARRQVKAHGAEVHLTPIEFKLLSLLIRHEGKVLTHRQLLTETWGPEYSDENHYLRVYMGQLRQKLEVDPAQPRLLTTEPGIGYRLRTD